MANMRKKHSVAIKAALVHSVGMATFSSRCHGASMPHKHNAARRNDIPKMAFKVRNWPAYEAGLRRRGSLTLWFHIAMRFDHVLTSAAGLGAGTANAPLGDLSRRDIERAKVAPLAWPPEELSGETRWRPRLDCNQDHPRYRGCGSFAPPPE